jgi:death-on-curing protein
MEPEFLEFDEVIELHERSLAEYGGSSGLRDENWVRSAVAQPRNDFYYGRADLFGIAAAYAFHIAQAQAFLDGNKRTGLAAATAFLELNGVNTDADQSRLVEAMIAIAERRLDKAGLAALFRELFA